MSDSKPPKSNSHVKDLLLLFSIPVAIALIAAAVIYLPRLLADPKTDFIYSVCGDYSCKNSFAVDSDGSVFELDDTEQDEFYRERWAELRYYDASDDSTRSLTTEEAVRYQLNTSSKSPDGYVLAKESSESGFLFWGNYDDGWYLKDGGKKKQVELTTDGSSYSNEIKFLGWVKQ